MKKQILLLPVFISGASLMVVEIVGARIMAPYLGTTIFSWAAVISAVLFSLSLGYFFGGKIADKYKHASYLAIIFLLASLSTLAIPFLVHNLLPHTKSLDVASASLIASLLLIPASFFYGMVSPFAIRILSKKGHEGRVSGGIFAFSTVGSIVGTLGAGFVLVPSMGLASIFFLTSALMAISALLVFGVKG